MEVRCCCEGSLQGYYAHPKLVKVGDRVRIPIMRQSLIWRGATDLIAGPSRENNIELSVDLFGLWGDARIAIKAEHVPIETLRSLNGFTEATEEERAESVRLYGK